MGIRGLFSYIAKTASEETIKEFTKTIKSDSVLIVDGTAFAMNVVDKVHFQYLEKANKYENAVKVPQFGYSNEALYKMMFEEISFLVNTCKFTLYFYFDGSGRQMKAATSTSRRVEKNERYNRLYHLCLNGQSMTGEGLKAVDYPLATSNFDRILRDCLDSFPSVCSITTDAVGEADSVMGLHCSMLNVNPSDPVCYCYTLDSDFVAFKNCPTIKIGTLVSSSSINSSKDSLLPVIDSITAVVYTRTEVAKLLELAHEELLIELSILAGNDFSSHIENPVEFINKMTAITMSDSVANVSPASLCAPASESVEESNAVEEDESEEIELDENICPPFLTNGGSEKQHLFVVFRNWLNWQYRHRNTPQLLLSNSPVVTQIIKFCRAFYNLDSKTLRKFPYDKSVRLSTPLNIIDSIKDPLFKFIPEVVGFDQLGYTPNIRHLHSIWDGLYYFLCQVIIAPFDLTAVKAKRGYGYAREVQALYGHGVQLAVVGTSWRDIELVQLIALAFAAAMVDNDDHCTRLRAFLRHFLSILRLNPHSSNASESLSGDQMNLIIEHLVHQYQTCSASVKVAIDEFGGVSSPPQWTDVVACSYYDQIVQIFLKFHPTIHRVGHPKTVSALSPLSIPLFNAQYYYSILSVLRTTMQTFYPAVETETSANDAQSHESALINTSPLGKSFDNRVFQFRTSLQVFNLYIVSTDQLIQLKNTLDSLVTPVVDPVAPDSSLNSSSKKAKAGKSTSSTVSQPITGSTSTNGSDAIDGLSNALSNVSLEAVTPVKPSKSTSSASTPVSPVPDTSSKKPSKSEKKDTKLMVPPKVTMKKAKSNSSTPTGTPSATPPPTNVPPSMSGKVGKNPPIAPASLLNTPTPVKSLVKPPKHPFTPLTTPTPPAPDKDDDVGQNKFNDASLLTPTPKKNKGGRSVPVSALLNEVNVGAGGNSKNNGVAEKPDVSSAYDCKLPIDAYEEQILDQINNNRISIIHGETGCGKSSRLPLMLYRHGARTGRPIRMMVSQPRRIAALALMNRLRPELGDHVGLRMGHDTRNETPLTNLWFVTTGYLIRYLAHNPQNFNNHTHLIIDEVHERSVDCDLLCYFCRQLLTTHPNIRIVLMSATLHTVLYQTYFHDYQYIGMKPYANGSGDENSRVKCLSVGLKRFPVTVHYVNELLTAAASGPAKSIKSVMTACNGGGGAREAVPPALFEAQCKVAMDIISSHEKDCIGKAILLFVSGFAEIEKLTELLLAATPSAVVNGIKVPIQFNIIPLHSDLSDDQQELVFLPVDADKMEIKIIIATNIAESSITLPDVDVILCFGSSKIMIYDSQTHTSRLVQSWITKDSATQRAGRTGRVKAGCIYRLYTESKYKTFAEHELSEFQRKPLEDILLSLRMILESSPDFEGVEPVLEQLPEPPELNNIEQSAHALYQSGMISSVDDCNARLTNLGTFTGQLCLGTELGQLIFNGVLLDVTSEVVVLAAALSMQKSPYRQAIPLIINNPGEYNEAVRLITLSQLHFDNGLLSQPLMYLQLYAHWNIVMASKSHTERTLWCQSNGLVYSRMKQFDALVQSISRRVMTLVHHSHRNTSSQSDDGSSSIFTTSWNKDKDDDRQTRKEGKQAWQLTNDIVNKLRLLLCWGSMSSNLYVVKPQKPTAQSDAALSFGITSCLKSVAGKASGESMLVSKDHLSHLFSNKVVYGYAGNKKAVAFDIISNCKIMCTAHLSVSRCTLGLQCIQMNAGNSASLETISLLPFCLLKDLVLTVNDCVQDLHVDIVDETNGESANVTTAPNNSSKKQKNRKSTSAGQPPISVNSESFVAAAQISPICWSSHRSNSDPKKRNLLVCCMHDGGVNVSQCVDSMMGVIDSSNVADAGQGTMIAFASSSMSQILSMLVNPSNDSDAVSTDQLVNKCSWYLLLNIGKNCYSSIVSILESCVFSSSNSTLAVSVDVSDAAVITMKVNDNSLLPVANSVSANQVVNVLTTDMKYLNSVFFYTCPPTKISVQGSVSSAPKAKKGAAAAASAQMITFPVDSMTENISSSANALRPIFPTTDMLNYTRNSCKGAILLCTAASGYRQKSGSCVLHVPDLHQGNLSTNSSSGGEMMDARRMVPGQQQTTGKSTGKLGGAVPTAIPSMTSIPVYNAAGATVPSATDKPAGVLKEAAEALIVSFTLSTSPFSYVNCMNNSSFYDHPEQILSARINAKPSQGAPGLVRLPRQCILNGLQYNAKNGEVMFAVAHSSMITMTLESIMINIDYITCLPLGQRWMYLAACSQKCEEKPNKPAVAVSNNGWGDDDADDSNGEFDQFDIDDDASDGSDDSELELAMMEFHERFADSDMSGDPYVEFNKFWANWQKTKAMKQQKKKAKSTAPPSSKKSKKETKQEKSEKKKQTKKNSEWNDGQYGNERGEGVLNEIEVYKAEAIAHRIYQWSCDSTLQEQTADDSFAASFLRRKGHRQHNRFELSPDQLLINMVNELFNEWM